MRALFLTLLLSFLTAALGQDFSPQPGETYLKLVVEGRGTIWIQLFTKEAPLTTKRIIELTQQGFYDGQRFFEVARKPRPYMARIGDPNSRTKPMDDKSLGSYSTGTKIPYENSGMKHVEGAVGLSRLPQDKDTGDCQFYIMLDKHGFLDGNYTVFGQVVSNLNLLKSLEVGDRVTTATIVRG